MGRPRRTRVSRRRRAAVVPPVAAPAPQPVAAPAPAAPVTSSAAIFLADELRALVQGLLFLSESEAPFTVLELPKEAILPDALRAAANVAPDAPAEEWTVADVLETRATADPADDPDAPRFRALQTFLETRLTHAVVYKLGEIKKPVFFIGRQTDRSWLAVQTEAVET